MHYVTTRNNQETYTPLYALNEARAPDGGVYVPAKLPVFSQEEIDSFALKNPNQAVAEILNRMFLCELNRWDLDFAIGRYPVRLSNMNRRITVAESWHNQEWDFSWMLNGLAARIRGSRDTTMPTGTWAGIAVRIGVLFGVFGELMREGIAGRENLMDVSVPSGDFSCVMAVWYAREMGLPIGNIVISCNENNALWDLINHGELRTGKLLHNTTTPECDHVVPPNLELLIHACGGKNEVDAFLRAKEEGRTYFPSELTFQKMQKGFYASVVGQRRVEATIPAAYNSYGYVLGPYSALSYAGLLDYHSRTGENSSALILSERGALCDDGFVAAAMGITVNKLHKILD